MNGPEDTAISVRVLSDGIFRIDGGMLVYGVPSFYGKVHEANLRSLLIEAGDDLILVDTGIGELPDRLREIYGVERNGGLVASLEGEGHCAEDVTMVINTHLHLDHCGNNGSFTNARFISQEEEIRYSASPDRFQKGGYHQPFIRGIRYHAVKGEKRLAPGVTVLPTPGHTPGHQSVIVELPHEVVIFTGDVSPLKVNHEKKYIVGVLYNPVDALNSLELIDDLKYRFGKPVRYVYSHE